MILTDTSVRVIANTVASLMWAVLLLYVFWVDRRIKRFNKTLDTT